MQRRIVLAAVMTLIFSFVPSPARAASCTRVAGGSQTTNWYTDGGFQSLVVDAEWERMSRGGQSLGTWDVNGSGWRTRIWSACSPATSPTRFVLHVLPDHSTTQAQVDADLAAALEAIPIKLPSVTRITLVPPVGGPCNIGLAETQPLAIQAINAQVGGIVDAGPVVNVTDCSMFRDNAGHLTRAGAQYAAQQFAAGL